MTFTTPIISFMESSWAKTIPVIDGSFDNKEWADATHLSFNHTDPSPGHDPDFVHIYIKNTDNKLFLLFDDLPDDTEEVDDHLYVHFDANLDGVLDNALNMILDRAHDPGSSVAGNNFTEWVIGFGPSPNKVIDHSIMEVAIDITFDSVYDGSSTPSELNYILPVGTENNTIKVFFSASFYFCGWEIPQDGDINIVETYGSVLLDATPPMKTYVLILIIVGGLVVLIALIGGTMLIRKRR